MKKKTWLLLLLALTLIASAFAVPPLALRAAVERSLEAPRLADVSAYSLDEADNTVDKLAALYDPEIKSIRMYSDQKPSELIDKLQKELDTLLRLGALPRFFYDWIELTQNESVTIDPICIVLPARQLVFEVYGFHIWSANAYVLMDAATEKILQMSFHAGARELLAREASNSEGAAELEAWADYYGLKAGAYSELTGDPAEAALDDFPSDAYGHTALRQAVFTDRNGKTVLFGQYWRFDEANLDGICWGALE